VNLFHAADADARVCRVPSGGACEQGSRLFVGRAVAFTVGLRFIQIAF